MSLNQRRGALSAPRACTGRMSPAPRRRDVAAQQQPAVADPGRRDEPSCPSDWPGSRAVRPQRRDVAVDRLVVGDLRTVGRDPDVGRRLGGRVLGRDRRGGRDRRADLARRRARTGAAAVGVGRDDRPVVGRRRPLVARRRSSPPLRGAVRRHQPDVGPAAEHDRVGAAPRRAPATRQSKTATIAAEASGSGSPRRARSGRRRRPGDRGGVDRQVVVPGVAGVGAVEVADVRLAGAVGLGQASFDVGALASPSRIACSMRFSRGPSSRTCSARGSLRSTSAPARPRITASPLAACSRMIASVVRRKDSSSTASGPPRRRTPARSARAASPRARAGRRSTRRARPPPRAGSRAAAPPRTGSRDRGTAPRGAPRAGGPPGRHRAVGRRHGDDRHGVHMPGPSGVRVT